MRLNDLLGVLDSSPIVILQKNTDPNIFYARYLDDSEDSLSSDVLYFMRSADLEKIRDRSSNTPLSVLLLADEVPEEKHAVFDNIFCVSNMLEFDATFRLCESVLNRFIHMNVQIGEFIDLVTTKDDMNVHMQWISDFFGYPTSLLDNSFTYIAHSDISGFARFDTNILVNELQQGYIFDLDHVRRLQRDQNMTIFDGISRPRMVWHEEKKFVFYHSSIRIGNATAGILNVFLPPEKTLDPLELLFFEKIALLLRIVLQRNNAYAANKASFYTSFFSSMLSSQPNRAQNWESRLSSYGYVLQPNMYMVVAEQPLAFSTPTELNALASSLHHMFPWSIYFVYNNKVLLLCGTQEDTLTIPAVVDKKDNFFTANYLKLGISSVFHSIYDIAAHYEESETALRIGSSFSPNRHFYFYDDFRLCDMVDRLAKDHPLSTFCYPPFMDLVQYDKKHDSQLCTTLIHHLLFPKDPAMVCKRLNIHKNTLYFRLQKINSIMKVDTTNFSIASQIFVTTILLHYNHHVNEGNEYNDFYSLFFRNPLLGEDSN